ncbi:inositol monophosphatase [Erythrobacteraceae bacterium CFH 75059]|uniref:inositol monophosphatase family protein n=1 Tax=Qipengyuania thermophila TaxID=2509361 RepID=UPI0010223AFD|nr:inositol monophosphatase family protein [Qipengyuania thermophila]TCD05058.1 inositol monophosphatase [Erythrobacteraceae bacterium CFH 75059]
MSAALDRAVGDLLRRVNEQAILPHYRTLQPSDITGKAANDVVTIADHKAEALLGEGLVRIEPRLAVVGEEAAHAAPDVLDGLRGDCWLVDPLDGTNNFAAGHGPFGIIVALVRGGEARHGWLYDCLTGRLCSAHADAGAFVDGERVRARESGASPPVAAMSLVYVDASRRERLRRRLSGRYQLVDIPRCAAEQYPRLVLGQNDVSMFERTLPWDHAAGVLFLNEAGGVAARPDGTPYRAAAWQDRGLLAAATPRLWEQLARSYNDDQSCDSSQLLS